MRQCQPIKIEKPRIFSLNAGLAEDMMKTKEIVNIGSLLMMDRMKNWIQRKKGIR
jgi:hypothetical protein